MSLVEKSNSDNLYSKPECHVVSKAFQISKNTAPVDILFFKFRWRDPPASYIEVSYCDLLWSQTELHLVSFFHQCVLDGSKIAISNNLPVVEKEADWTKVWGKSGIFAGFRQSYNFCFLPTRRCQEMSKPKAVSKKNVICTRGLLGRCRRHSFGKPSRP
jgi:hypothetical protein